MRTKKAPKRDVQPDPIYNSRLVSKIISGCMHDGKKSLASKHVYQAVKIIEEKTKEDGLEYLQQAVENIKPQMEVRSRRVGGASYQVPANIRPERKQSLAIRWIIAAARARPNSEFHTFAEKLAAEIMEAYQNQGSAAKKKIDTHKMAEANKAFSHLRW